MPATAKTSATAVALRVGLLELAIVLLGLIFVRKEVYLSGQFKAMLLHWQEYAVLVLMFVDGILRGYGEFQDRGQYHSPFRKRFLRYLLPITLFLFVSCASLCDRVNVACIQQEWWRDLGLLLLVSGLGLSAWEQDNRPRELNEQFTFIEDDDSETESEEATPGGAESLEDKNKEISASVKIAESSESSPKAEKISDESSLQKDDVSEIKPEGPWKILRYPGRSSILLELVGVSMAISAWLPLLTLPGLIIAFKWEIADLEAFRISQLGEKYLNYKRTTWFLIPYIF